MKRPFPLVGLLSGLMPSLSGPEGFNKATVFTVRTKEGRIFEGVPANDSMSAMGVVNKQLSEHGDHDRAVNAVVG